MSDITNNNQDNNINRYLSETYTSDSFGGESGIMAVREDPSRHIQKTDKEGIFNMFTEIFDNAVDESIEVMARLKTLNSDAKLDPLEIRITIQQKEGICVIEDQGRGITIDENKKHQIPTVCAVYEKDNTGGKGKKSGVTNKGYTSKTMGVHGAGAFVVNACSEYITVRTRIYNEKRKCVEIYEIEYREGIAVESDDRLQRRLKFIGDDHSVIGNNRANTGTTVMFKPDLKIMSLYNPRTQQIEKDEYFLPLGIKKRIADTLYTMSEPMIIHLDIDGVIETYDSRELSYTYGKVEGQDYLRLELEPDAEMKAQMSSERVSNFYLDLIIMPLEDPYEANKYEGFVNRIRVTSSPHTSSIRYFITSEVSKLCSTDPDLQGYFRSDQLKGLKVIPLLYVEYAEWGGQVKTDYSDSRVSNYMGQMISKSKNLQKDGYFYPLIEYCFGCSKPWLLSDKIRNEEMLKVREVQDKREKENKEEKRLKDKLNDDLRWLNKNGMFFFTSDVVDSDIVIVEGKSAGNVFSPVMSKMPRLAVFAGMQGKIDNANKLEPYNPKNHETLAEKERLGKPISIPDRFDVIFSSPFNRYILMVDNDADGAHMSSLLRFYIWKRHKHLIEAGKVFDVKPQFCDYFCSESDLSYEYKGEIKTLDRSGSIRTQDEYDIVRKLYPDRIKFKLFKGVGSVASSDIYRILNNSTNWSQIPPLTAEEEYQIDKMFTDSSQFKKVFTEVNYMDEISTRKERVKKVVYKDTSIAPEEIVNRHLISDYPVFTSVNRRSLEDYEERGSEVIEIDNLKSQLEAVKEEYGFMY